MKYSSKIIKRSIRDFENILSDVEGANQHTYITLIGRFIDFTKNNDIIKEIIKPLINLKLNFEDILKRHPNGLGDLHLPLNINKHIAFVLQLFLKTEDKEFNFIDFLLSYFKQNTFDENIYIFNSSVVEPAFRELLIKLNDFIEDEVEGKEDVNITNYQIFNIGSISATKSNIIIGNNNAIINQNNIDSFKEDFIRELLSKGFNIEQIDNIRPSITTIHSEINKAKIDKSVFNKALSKLKEVGGNVMIQTITTLITKPEIIRAIEDFIQEKERIILCCDKALR